MLNWASSSNSLLSTTSPPSPPGKNTKPPSTLPSVTGHDKIRNDKSQLEAFTRLNPWILTRIRRTLERWNRAAETIPAVLTSTRNEESSPRDFDNHLLLLPTIV